jgi:glycosyltransferase involved in cell wall biosynthesis
MKKVILITSSFPYYPGEQFLETEIHYYGGIDVEILPLSLHVNKRNIPEHIKINNFLTRDRVSIFKKIFYVFKGMLEPLFYIEFFSAARCSTKKIRIFLASIYNYQRYKSLLNLYFKNKKNPHQMIIYTYWNNEVTYALQSLKSKYKYQLISRIHGGDLYQERRLFDYMPLKKHFLQNIDKIYTITEGANEYLSKTYGFKNETLELSRLGVMDFGIKASPSPEGCLNIVSCSFLTEIKRVDKIIDAIKALSESAIYTKITWRHIGDGQLGKYLRGYASERIGNSSLVDYKFLGNLENLDVYEFYKNNQVDVFLNTSESEGVPVSIMEAMSCHIPIIAPNVGGISDMMQDDSGFLLSEKCSVDEIALVLKKETFLKNNEIRENAYKLFLEKYNAEKNYIDFVNKITHLPAKSLKNAR